MKNSKLIAALLAIFLVISCTTELPEQSVSAPTERHSITLDIATPASRVALGDRTEESYPLYWSEGDRISINGVLSSEAVINADNPYSAIFDLDTPFSYPASILYPASTDGTIEFPATQSYIEGSFDTAAVPMHGYAKDNSKCEMQHLYSALRFSFTGSATLVSMDITAEKGALAGRYTVDCATGALSNATATSATITYSFGQGLTLGKEAKEFFVTLPAGDHGTCSIVLRDKSGSTMRLRFNSTGDQVLRRGVVREFQTVAYRINSNVSLQPLESEEDILDIPGIAQGYVLYNDGSPAVGVAVSDGFSVTQTDKSGYYRLWPSSDCYYIYISLPADCEIPTNEYGLPYFFRRYKTNTARYDFTLKRMAGGAEDEFILYGLGDPQVSSATKLKRFQNESMPHLKNISAKHGLNCYGITLGDIVSSSNTGDTSPYMPSMRTSMHINKSGTPIFQVMGNHDHKGNVSVKTDSQSSTLEIAAQRTFEECFGPINYSFNRGKVHIVGMRDIVYRFTTYGAGEYSSYARGFSKEQYEWLKQDLAVVPKDHMVVLCVHIPLYSQSTSSTYYVKQVFDLFNTFASSHIISGHTHNIYITTVSGYKTIEHNVGATCGAWWASNMCTDGAPNGFGVFHIKGATIKNEYYHGVNEGMNDGKYQMRLYRGTMISGGTYEYFATEYNASTLLAHVWCATPEWSIKAYLDGKELGTMTLVAKRSGDPWLYDANGKKLSTDDYNSQVSTIQAQTSISNPTRFTGATSADWYSIGYHVGVKKSKRSHYASGGHNNMYKIEHASLATADWSKVKVVAIDQYGNRYESTAPIQGTIGTDFTYAPVIAPSW